MESSVLLQLCSDRYTAILHLVVMQYTVLVSDSQTNHHLNSLFSDSVEPNRSVFVNDSTESAASNAVTRGTGRQWRNRKQSCVWFKLALQYDTLIYFWQLFVKRVHVPVHLNRVSERTDSFEALNAHDCVLRTGAVLQH